MFLGILAALALTAGTVQTVNELEYVDVMKASEDSAVVEVTETEQNIYQEPAFLEL